MEAGKKISEDWLSLWLGLAIFVLSAAILAGPDLLGWGTKTRVWTKVGEALAPVSPGYASMSAATSLIATYGFVLFLTGIGALLLKADLKKFALGFTVVYWISMACWILGHYAYIAATPDKLEDLNIGWSMNLTGEAGYIVALVAGLFIGNFMHRLADRIKEAIRPELYIKIAIVIMGAGLGLKAAESLGMSPAVMFIGFCAIVTAYLIFWTPVYWLARRYFKFSREWAAPLASGVSICGVSAAIATGGAIRTRPIVPITVSSLVIIFAAIELTLLPWCAKLFLWHEPLVAATWMGLAVKTDGAAVASGAITDAWIRAQAFAEAGTSYGEGWILMIATTVKTFIDIFIVVWVFILAFIWCAGLDRIPGKKIRAAEIWHRFPKFVIGCAATFVILLVVSYPASIMSKASESQIGEAEAQLITLERERTAAALGGEPTAAFDVRLTAARSRIEAIESGIATSRAALATARIATDENNVFRQLFFAVTFFTIGVVSNFKSIREERIGKLAAAGLVALFGFVIWIGLLISWIFFHGIKPPIAG